jgi:hypothetical protein
VGSSTNTDAVFSGHLRRVMFWFPSDTNLASTQNEQIKSFRSDAKVFRRPLAIIAARVGDLFMSLIHTCELNKVNPFDYLTELLRHPAEMKANPAAWMPWNYRREATAWQRNKMVRSHGRKHWIMA